LAVGLFSLPLGSKEQGGADEVQLKKIAHLLEQCVRGHDVVARYSQDEFVVLMPKSPLSGAIVLGERLVRMVDAEMDSPVWGGLVEAAPGDTPEKLLVRADSALYSARAHEGAALFQHNGTSVRRHAFELQPVGAGVNGDEQFARMLG
jgi:diguanylate cyclase (GGDEF)-like protein